MRNLPVVLDGYSLMVAEAPEPKTYKKDGKDVLAQDEDGNQMFAVSLFVKERKPNKNGRRSKGEEVRVTLEADPGEEFSDGDYVELVNPRVSPYQFKNDSGEVMSGISVRALTVKRVGSSMAA